MSRSDRTSSRRHPAQHIVVARRTRSLRRQWKRWTRAADDSIPYPTDRGMCASSCGHGCCW